MGKSAGQTELSTPAGYADRVSPGLSYYLPEVPRDHKVMHIPGSHTLYVGPLSCQRRHDIHARQYGDRRDVSFLYITQADVISGRYEDLLVEAVGQLREAIAPLPHIFFICTFCIDDFLGTDEEALLARLRASYPDSQFAFEHVDPVSMNERMNMGTKLISTQYSFIRPVPPGQHDRGINLLGVFVPFHPDCEFLRLIDEWGCGPLRSIVFAKTYEDYQDIGKSCLSLVFRIMNTQAADLMADQLGIPYLTCTPSYDARAVAETYNRIAQAVGCTSRDFSAEITSCEADARATAEALAGRPVALDCEFSLMVFAAAKALLQYGFNVQRIFRSNHKFPLDAEAEAWVVREHPEVQILRSADASHLSTDHAGEEVLCIGADCARILQARQWVDIWHDEGYFGFHGIHRLFADMRAAAAGGAPDVAAAGGAPDGAAATGEGGR